MQLRPQSIFPTLALLIAAMLFAPGATGQPGTPEPNAPGDPVPPDDTPVTPRELPPATAPEWVVPGARITLYGQVATTLERNDPINPRIPVGGTGYEQYDILALTPEGVLIEHRSYGIPINQTRPQLREVRVYLADTASGGQLWVPAPELANVPVTTDPNANPKIELAPYQIEGETYDAIHFTRVENTPEGEVTTHRVYDQRTGIVLYQSTIVESREGRVHIYGEFRAYRVAELPWRSSGYTDRVRGFNRLVYDVYTTKETPGFPDQQIGSEFTFAIGQSTETVMQVGVTMRRHAQGNAPPINDTPGEPVPQSLCAGQRLGLYIAPDVLGRLENGQVLDEDPVVGYTIRVTEVYQVDGITLVEITEQGPDDSYTVACTYDASVGLMVASVQTLPEMDLTRETVLQRVE